jgi:Insertion element 4 transposase N-terminal/Transposase DDE domain
LPCQSALSRAATTITHTITVAAGVFAPGHVGELTAIVPLELVDAVLEETRAVQRRPRDLPSRVGVYFVLAMCLFPEVGYHLVWGKLIAGLEGLAVATPTAKALRDLRRRIGVAPVKELFEVLAGPLAQPGTPGVRFGRYQTVSFDGRASQKVPGTERNRDWLGRSGRAGYPMLELMTLVETGTRALPGAVFGPTAEGETSYAGRLLHLLDAGMLVLWDKGFDGNAFLSAVAATGAQFLGRVKNSRRPPVLARLADGSYLSVIGGLKVRIIEAVVTVTCADATTYTGVYRLVTTLTDHRGHPAAALIRLYHERWEHESAYYALRHTIMDGRVLRSGDRVGIEQEMWSLLTLYQVLRTAMVSAAESRPGTDPDRAGFTIAFQTAREQLIKAAAVVTETADLIGAIGRRILAGLLPARRLRVSTRKVKSPISRYHARQHDGRPSTSQNVTALDIAVHEPQATAPVTPSTPRRSTSAAPSPTPSNPDPEQTETTQTPLGTGRKERVLALLRSQPRRHWHGREVARELGVTNINSFRVQMSQWSHRGLLHKTGPATYTLPLCQAQVTTSWTKPRTS